MADQIKNIFISHVDKDHQGLTDLKDLLKNNGLFTRGSSITPDNSNKDNSPEYFKSEILKPRIDWAGCLIVYISPETKDNNEWVNWGIEEANRQNKAIIGVWEPDQNACEIPKALDQYGNALVCWNAKKIIDAINGDFVGFEHQDGTPMPKRPIRRHPCG